MRETIDQLLREGMSVHQVMAKTGLPEDERWQVESAMEDPLTWVEEKEYLAELLLEVR